jgi:guanylate kinase
MPDELIKIAAKPRPFLMVLSAPSGGGKTTVCERLLKKHPWLKRCVTATTRAPRQGEKNGRDYFFLSRDEFRRRARLNGFYEWANVHGQLYGTPRKELESSLKKGQSLVLVIDVQGGAQVKRMRKDAVLVFLLPPSLSALEKRLKSRAQDPAEVIKRRLRDARRELKAAARYDYLVLNKELPRAVAQVAEIAAAARWRKFQI